MGLMVFTQAILVCMYILNDWFVIGKVVLFLVKGMVDISVRVRHYIKEYKAA